MSNMMLLNNGLHTIFDDHRENKMWLLVILFPTYVVSSTFRFELDGLVKSYRLRHGPQGSELLSPVIDLARAAAKDGKTRVDIIWRELVPIKGWLDAGGVDIVEDDGFTTFDHLSDSFLDSWKVLCSDVHSVYYNDTMSLCWMDDRSCLNDQRTWRYEHAK